MFSGLFKFIGTVLVALNQLGNALTGGQPDMAMSARAGLARENGSKAAIFWCELLDWVDPRDGDGPNGDHCAMSAERYRTRTVERFQRASGTGDAPVMMGGVFVRPELVTRAFQKEVLHGFTLGGERHEQGTTQGAQSAHRR